MNAGQQLPPDPHRWHRLWPTPHPKLGLTFSWAPGFMVAVVSLLSAQGPRTLLCFVWSPESDKCRSGSARIASRAGDPRLDQRCSCTRGWRGRGNEDPHSTDETRGAACSRVVGGGAYAATPDVSDHKARLPQLTKSICLFTLILHSPVSFSLMQNLFSPGWPGNLFPRVALEK